jgi:hypothetical protein
LSFRRALTTAQGVHFEKIFELLLVNIFAQTNHTSPKIFLNFLFSFPSHVNLSPAEMSIWKALFDSLPSNQSILSEILTEPPINRHSWVSHIEPFLLSKLHHIEVEILAPQNQDRISSICRELITVGRIEVVPFFILKVTDGLVSERVIESRRQAFIRFMSRMKVVYQTGNELLEWTELCLKCSRRLSSKKKVQDVVKNLMS